MHVVQSIVSLDPANGGTSRTVVELACAVAAAGVSTTVWTPHPQQPEWVQPLRTCGVEVESGPLARLLERRPAELVVHSHGVWLPTNHRMAKFAAVQRVPRVVSPHGMLEPWALSHRKWKKRLAWALYQRRDLERASSLHATSAMEAGNIRRLGISRPVFTVPNGIAEPESTFRDVGQWAGDGRGAVGGARDVQRQAVFLSRLHPKKGLPMLADAWSRVRPPGWRMVVVGPDEGGHRAEVEARIARLGLDPCWEFRDQADGDEKWRALADAELSILPTYSENFGNVVPESLLVETPVLTTTGAPWSGLVDQQCGWWVEPTVDGLAAGLQAACSLSPETLREMGRRGRDWAQREFAWPGIAQRMIAAYEAALTGRSPGELAGVA